MYSDLASYYNRWYHDRPVLIGAGRREELRTLHAVLLKCAHHFVRVWRDYLPLGEREQAILAEQERYPLRLGTWRPDYILCADGSLRICEITSRFFAHGIFMSWFGHQLGLRFLSSYPGAERHDDFDAMMQKMLDITGGRRRMYVFKSSDRTGEIRLYKRFYEANGLTVTVLEAPEVERHMPEWASGDCFLVSALNQHDIMAMGDRTLQAMMENGICSDMRNVFLVHDKRFMKSWFDDSFTSGCLTQEETAFLRSHAIPTFEAAEKLPELAAGKDAWILKPWRLGKSEGVHAGPLTPEDVWARLLANPGGFIVQPFMPQRTFPCTWEGQHFEDYMCGMMICIDDGYYESGYFRCSSLPVTNVGDDRKAAVIYGGPSAIENCCDRI